MTQLIKKIFSGEITEARLGELRAKYPVDLVSDMTDDDTFKTARKVRTERNKLVENITRRRIDTSSEIKTYGDSLIEQVNDIYSVVVSPFEKEAEARKKKEAEEAEKLKKIIAAEAERVNDIREFVGECRGKDSAHIQGTIEAVDLIDVDVFHKDVIHSAIEAKKTTLRDLAQLLIDTTAREKVEEERQKIRDEKEKEDNKQRQIELSRQVSDRINKLKMTPIELFGATSGAIRKRIDSLGQFEITEDEFSGRADEVVQEKAAVIGQLTKMLDTQLKAEEIQAAEDKRISEHQASTEVSKEELKSEPVVAKESPSDSRTAVPDSHFPSFSAPAKPTLDANPDQAAATMPYLKGVIMIEVSGLKRKRVLDLLIDNLDVEVKSDSYIVIL